jgi:hypothetical protein
MNEIKVKKPKISITLSEETQNIIKDRVISYIKKIIQGDDYTPSYSFLDYLLDEVYISDGDSNYDIVASFIIEQMIANNYELYNNGEEILLTNSNSNLITREDIENYLEENIRLKKYLEKLTWEYYFNEIDINDLYRECIRAVKNDMEHGNWGEGEYDKEDFESIVDKELDNYDLWPDSILTYNPKFQDYLQSKFLRADKLNEMRINKLKILKEEETAYHGSSNYFTSFKKEGIGGGAGAQAFGWGLYFSTTPDIAKGYRNVGGKGNTSKTKTLFQGKTAEELGLEYENEIFFGLPLGLKTSQDYIEYAEESISLIEEEPDFEGKEDLIKDYKRFIEIIKDLEIEQEPMQYFYKVTLFPGKTPDYLNWDKSSTPQNQIDKINKEAQKEGWEGFEINSNMSPKSIYEYIDQYILDNKKNKYSLGTDQYITYKAGPDTSMFLVRAGIDGNTHSNGEVRIVFDDKQIKIDKIYKVKDFDTIDESKKPLLREYSEKVIKQMIDKFQKEMRNTLSDDDIKLKISRFEQIKSNLPKKIEAGLKGEAGGIIVPKKFTEPDPRTNKILNPQDILNYTWKDLETIIDAYGTKGEKTSKDFNTIQDADFVDVQGVPVTYNGNGLKVYEGSSYEGCVKLNYAFKYKGEDDKIYSYGFCIGRKEDSANQYYTYRFGRGGAFRSFYYVADTTQDADIKGDPSNRENFINWYHFFVIHAFDDGGYGVTDACNVWGSNHEATGGDKGITWEQVGAFMIKHGGESGKKAWDKIKNIRNVFKYVEPSSKETDEALVRDKILNFEQFKNLNRNQKRIYISKRADQPNAFNSEMFSILDIDLKNLALRTGTGFKPTYNDIKGSDTLSRSYARFRFTRAINDIKDGKRIIAVLPLPFVPFLTDEEKEKYYEEFDKVGEESFLTFELLEKYFGDKLTKQYVNSQLKNLGFLPPEAIKYIDNPKLKTLFKTISKLYEPWKYGKYTNISDEELTNSSSQPPQDVTPLPIDVKQWAKLTPEERKLIIELTEKYNKNENYSELMWASPFIIKDKGQTLLLLPEPSSTGDYEKWVLINDQNRVIKRNISGESTLEGENISSGYSNGVSEDFKRVYDIKDLDIVESDSKSLDEIKVNKPNKTWDFTKSIKNFNISKVKKGDIIIMYNITSNKNDEIWKFTVDKIIEDEFNPDNYFASLKALNPIPSQPQRMPFNKGFLNKLIKTSLDEIKVNKPNSNYKLNFPDIKTVDIDSDDEVAYIIETIAKLNPKIPQQYFEAGSVFDDVTDWIGNKIDGPIVPFKVFLESYFYWLGRNLVYDLNPDNENLYDIDYDSNEVERFAKAATDGTWLMIPGISDFNNLNYIKEIKVNKPGNYIKLNFPNIETISLDNWEELNNFINTLVKLNPSIPEDFFYNARGDVSNDWKSNNVNLKDFLESYFFEIAHRLFYSLNHNEENGLEDQNLLNLEQYREIKRFAKEAANGKWLMIPGITDFKNINEIKVNKPQIGKNWTDSKLYNALIQKGMDLNAAFIWESGNYIGMTLDTYKKYTEAEIENYLESLKFEPISLREQTISSVHGGDYYEWTIRCENPNPEKLEIKDGNDLWELMKPEFEKFILGDLDEIKINKPGDLSNPTNLKNVLDKIPNEKYFPIIKDGEEHYIPYDDTRWDDIASNIVDDLYDPIFDEYLKGKLGIKEDDYWDFFENEREKNDDEQGPLERLIVDKIWVILNDYKNQQKELEEIKVNKPGSKTWDFAKYIPNLNVKKIEAGDIIIMPQTNPITPHGKLKVSSISDFDDTVIFDDGRFLYLYDLIKKNKQNKENLDEIKVNTPGDLSNPITLEKILDKIPSKKYFQELENYEGEERWDDSELMDILYEPFFNNELKGKLGIKEDNYWDWRDKEREKSNGDYSLLDSLVLDKLWSIVEDYRNQQEELEEIKVNKPGGDYMQIWPIGELINFFKNDQDVFKGSNIDKIIKQNIQELKKKIWERYKEVYMEYDIDDNEYVKDYPKNSNDVFNPEKQTGNLYDAAYYESGDLILPYINKFLNDKQWKYVEDDVFKKDDREIEVFDYIYHNNDLDYDTDPREGVYVNFIEYFEKNNPPKVNEIKINKPGANFTNLIKQYQLYLDSISRAEMFDENGMYNSKLKDYHNKLKYYTQNGTEKEQEMANFILSWI